MTGRPVLAADAKLEIAARLRPSSTAMRTTGPTPSASKVAERILVQDLLVLVDAQELAGVVGARSRTSAA